MLENLFDHIAIATEQIADASAVLTGLLGGVPDYGAASRDYRFCHWRFEGGGRLEILEPIGTNGFLRRFLRDRGPGIHHVTFRVPSLSEACDLARANGYHIVGYDDSNPSWKEAFLHPKEALGIVVQLAESTTSGADVVAPRFIPPDGPRNSPPPVTIVGLRMRAASRERAWRQWERVLGGRGTEGPAGELVYRWPDSPMRLAVEVDSSAAEGALAIEYSSQRPVVRLPPSRHPLLGAAFIRVPLGVEDAP